MEPINWKDFETLDFRASTIVDVEASPKIASPPQADDGPPSGEVVLLHPEGKVPDGRKTGMNPAHNSGGRPLKFEQFKAMTFDCYGTLIDWESGLLNAIQPLLRSHGVRLREPQVLEIYSEVEPQEQSPYRPYREVLANVVRRFGERLSFVASEKEAESLPNSLPAWLPFADTNPALEKLKTKYKLAIISNTDDAFFAATSRHFGIRFDEVITAEQAKAYKPSLAPFQLALQRLELTPQQVLHVGQSVHHDVLPAKSLGLSTVLVYRRGFGATRPSSGEPDLRVPDLKTLADLAVH